ncbi:MAG TPA: FTR1 family protein [Ktedonobacterales bacterium]
MLPAFILLLREGLEASLIVSLMLAALRQLGETRQVRAVWIGVGLAAAASLIGGVIIYATVREYNDTTFQTIFETGTYIVAVAILTSMTFWMQRHSRTLKKEIMTRASVNSSGFALGLLAFTMVGREGLEASVFALAFAFETSGVLWLTGAALGLLAAIALSWAIYRLGYRLDFRVFFRWMGILLLIFAAGLVADAVQNLQALGWVTFGTTHLWSTAHLLAEDSMLGDLLHSFIGYAQSPTVLQVSLYLLYLLVAGGYFFYITRKPGGEPAPAHGTVAPATRG